uniref:Uncharacterized protein n=1 Tax=Homalodisca liturata TaxID=320908 RepID=A0A1B6IQN5_9HEMI
MDSNDELYSIREKLMEALGDKAKVYCQHMKMWFHMKWTKEQFDAEVRKILDPKQAHLHNQFLLHMYIKCSKPDLPPHSRNDGRSKSKRRGRQSSYGFEQTNVQEFAPTRITQRPPDDPPRYCGQELLLPDQELIYMRLTLSAWELGLKGAERGAAEMLVAAVRVFLKNIVTTVVSRRNGFRMRGDGIQHSIGVPVPNPWLKNTSGIVGSREDETKMEILDNGENAPAARPSTTELQQDVALTYSASTNPAKKRPITAMECYEALQIYRNSVSSHGVYSINMERLTAQMSHPGWDDVENNLSK